MGAVCPECGVPVDAERGRRALHWLNLRRLLPLVFAAAAAIALGALTVFNSGRTHFGPDRAGIANWGSWTFPNEAVTVEQLLRMASEPGADDGSLRDAIADALPGAPRSYEAHEVLLAGCVGRSGVRHTSIAYGWPWPVYRVTKAEACSDVYGGADQGVPVGVAFRGSLWVGWTLFLAGASSIDVGAVACVALLVVGAAEVGPRLVRRLVRGRSNGVRERAGRWVWRVIGVAVMALVLMNAWSLVRPTELVQRNGGVLRSPLTRLTEGPAELRRIAATPGAASGVAAEIVAAMGTAQPGSVLAFQADTRVSVTGSIYEAGRATPLFLAATQRNSIGGRAIDIPPHKFHAGWSGTGLVVVPGAGLAAPSVTRYTIDFGAIAVEALAVWAVWRAAWLLCGARRVMVVRRRQRAGLCLECGYDLRGGVSKGGSLAPAEEGTRVESWR